MARGLRDPDAARPDAQVGRRAGARLPAGRDGPGGAARRAAGRGGGGVPHRPVARPPRVPRPPRPRRAVARARPAPRGPGPGGRDRGRAGARLPRVRRPAEGLRRVPASPRASPRSASGWSARTRATGARASPSRATCATRAAPGRRSASCCAPSRPTRTCSSSTSRSGAPCAPWARSGPRSSATWRPSRSRRSTSTRTSAPSAATARTTCSGAARTATSGTPSWRSGSGRRRNAVTARCALGGALAAGARRRDLVAAPAGPRRARGRTVAVLGDGARPGRRARRAPLPGARLSSRARPLARARPGATLGLALQGIAPARRPRARRAVAADRGRARRRGARASPSGRGARRPERRAEPPPRRAGLDAGRRPSVAVLLQPLASVGAPGRAGPVRPAVPRRERAGELRHRWPLRTRAWRASRSTTTCWPTPCRSRPPTAPAAPLADPLLALAPLFWVGLLGAPDGERRPRPLRDARAGGRRGGASRSSTPTPDTLLGLGPGAFNSHFATGGLREPDDRVQPRAAGRPRRCRSRAARSAATPRPRRAVLLLAAAVSAAKTTVLPVVLGRPRARRRASVSRSAGRPSWRRWAAAARGGGRRRRAVHAVADASAPRATRGMAHLGIGTAFTSSALRAATPRAGSGPARSRAPPPLPRVPALARGLPRPRGRRGGRSGSRGGRAAAPPHRCGPCAVTAAGRRGEPARGRARAVAALPALQRTAAAVPLRGRGARAARPPAAAGRGLRGGAAPRLAALPTVRARRAGAAGDAPRPTPQRPRAPPPPVAERLRSRARAGCAPTPAATRWSSPTTPRSLLSAFGEVRLYYENGPLHGARRGRWDRRRSRGRSGRRCRSGCCAGRTGTPWRRPGARWARRPGCWSSPTPSSRASRRGFVLHPPGSRAAPRPLPRGALRAPVRERALHVYEASTSRAAAPGRRAGGRPPRPRPSRPSPRARPRTGGEAARASASAQRRGTVTGMGGRTLDRPRDPGRRLVPAPPAGDGTPLGEPGEGSGGLPPTPTSRAARAATARARDVARVAVREPRERRRGREQPVHVQPPVARAHRARATASDSGQGPASSGRAARYHGPCAGGVNRRRRRGELDPAGVERVLEQGDGVQSARPDPCPLPNAAQPTLAGHGVARPREGREREERLRKPVGGSLRLPDRPRRVDLGVGVAPLLLDRHLGAHAGPRRVLRDAVALARAAAAAPPGGSARRRGDRSGGAPPPPRGAPRRSPAAATPPPRAPPPARLLGPHARVDERVEPRPGRGVAEDPRAERLAVDGAVRGRGSRGRRRPRPPRRPRRPAP